MWPQLAVARPSSAARAPPIEKLWSRLPDAVTNDQNIPVAGAAAESVPPVNVLEHFASNFLRLRRTRLLVDR
jgi:hypothetical protein